MADILIFEDDLTLAMHFRECLEMRGHRVIHEVSTEAVFATLEEVRFDVVICDVMVRGMVGQPPTAGGLTVITHINFHIQPVPKVIVITGSDATLNVLRHAELMRVARSLHKPLDPNTLADVVDEVLNEPSSSETVG